MPRFSKVKFVNYIKSLSLIASGVSLPFSTQACYENLIAYEDEDNRENMENALLYCSIFLLNCGAIGSLTMLNTIQLTPFNHYDFSHTE